LRRISVTNGLGMSEPQVGHFLPACFEIAPLTTGPFMRESVLCNDRSTLLDFVVHARSEDVS
jgi:hypothetical protein